ncbi:NUDIX hydrolase [Candidatus Poriferisodalis sp.]|uniref:NUDIX hydrolase n=1 Tax=Candidatus Poriferisodalis sp. TaxID=3101277 RepID=UPI003B52553A
MLENERIDVRVAAGVEAEGNPEPTELGHLRCDVVVGQHSVVGAFEAERLSEVLSQDLDTSHEGPTAAVAAVVRQGDGGPEMLFIERAIRNGDPWSGHMAFPGGRTEPDDDDTFDTAVRESREEIGFDITAHAGVHWLGRLNDLEGNPRWRGAALRVTPHVCWLAGDRPDLTLNYEVADALWVSVAELADPKHHIDYLYPPRPDERFPGIEVGHGRVVWGMTLRMLQDLFTRAGHPLPITFSPSS